MRVFTFKIPARGTLKTLAKPQKNQVKNSIPTSKNEKEIEDSSNKEYKPKNRI